MSISRLATKQYSVEPDVSGCIFNGAGSDGLTRSISLAATTQVTVNFIVRPRTTDFTYIWNVQQSSTLGDNSHVININSGTTLDAFFRNTAGTEVFRMQYAGLTLTNVYHITFSFDTSNTSKRHLIVNGVDVTGSASFLDYGGTIESASSRDTDIMHFDELSRYPYGDLGEFYYDNAYMDLSSSNPFLIPGTLSPRNLAQVISATGVTPDIALPINISDPGNNLGTAGDFTLVGSIDEATFY